MIERVENALNTFKISELPFLNNPDNLIRNLINGFIALLCILGLVGNGRTIYLLAFSIKRNSFTTYILNLSIADFGVLTSLIVAAIFVTVLTPNQRTYMVDTFFFLIFEFFFFIYSASQFLLMAISLDRCVAVLFPLWHHCRRPPYLSTPACWLIWILSFLLSAVHFIFHQKRGSGSSPLLYQLIVNGLFCTPLTVLSTINDIGGVHWEIQMRTKSQHTERKLLATVLLALLFFLLFSLPMYTSYVIYYFGFLHPVLLTIGVGSAVLNSSINPLLYYLLGRKKRGKTQPRTSLKVALESSKRSSRAAWKNSELQRKNSREVLLSLCIHL